MNVLRVPRCWRVIFCISVVCGLQVRSCEAQSPDVGKPEATLETDVRLQKRVSIEATGVPVGELLAGLSNSELRLTVW